mmetsp:Transcript_792/g.1001  ORF Transcript_792/g.1001 Transcript_792/m.1001 type:complete len:249 (-) Transcript_792:1582-2328(-)
MLVLVQVVRVVNTIQRLGLPVVLHVQLVTTVHLGPQHTLAVGPEITVQRVSVVLLPVLVDNISRVPPLQVAQPVLVGTIVQVVLVLTQLVLGAITVQVVLVVTMHVQRAIIARVIPPPIPRVQQVIIVQVIPLLPKVVLLVDTLLLHQVHVLLALLVHIKTLPLNRVVNLVQRATTVQVLVSRLTIVVQRGNTLLLVLQHALVVLLVDIHQQQPYRHVLHVLLVNIKQALDLLVVRAVLLDIIAPLLL